MHSPPPQWSQPRLGRSWQFGFFHLLIRTLGKRPAYHIAYIVSLYYLLFSPSIRQRTRFYLDKRFPNRSSSLAKFRDSFRVTRHYARHLIDIAVMQILGPSSLKCHAVNREEFLKLCSADSGVLLLNGHFGCFQTAMTSLAAVNKPIHIVIIPGPETQAMLAAGRGGGTIIDPRTGAQSAMEITAALLAGHVVSMMADRTFGDLHNVVHASFLGSDAPFPLAPYRIASATGTPIGIMMAPKTGFKTCQIGLVKIIHVPPNLGRNPAAYRPYAQQFATALEEIVHQYPYQFFNFYDMWDNSSPS